MPLIESLVKNVIKEKGKEISFEKLPNGLIRIEVHSDGGQTSTTVTKEELELPLYETICNQLKIGI